MLTLEYSTQFKKDFKKIAKMPIPDILEVGNIISQLQRTETEVTRQLDQFRFDLASQALYEFIWNQYCDWYLELSKPVLWDENAPIERQRGTRRTLVRVLEVALRLAHPFMPFITEEIWQRIAPLAGIDGKTIMLQPWPVANEARIDAAAEGDIEWLKELMVGLRNIRAEMNIGPGKPLPLFLKNANADDQRRLQENEALLKKLAKVESFTVLGDADEAPLSATALVGDLQVLVPMAGLIDKGAELARLDKEIQRLQGEVQRVGGKLSNAGFVDKAPAEVIEKERAKLAEAEQAMQAAEREVADRTLQVDRLGIAVAPARHQLVLDVGYLVGIAFLVAFGTLGDHPDRPVLVADIAVGDVVAGLGVEAELVGTDELVATAQRHVALVLRHGGGAQQLVALDVGRLLDHTHDAAVAVRRHHQDLVAGLAEALG